MTALLMGGLAASLGAQASVTIDPGMSREQVVAKLGEPLSIRMYDGHTYLFYKNGCEKSCGMSDLVVLDSGKVVDAVFRASGRKYSGTSSSPRMISETEAKRANGGGAPLALPTGEPKPPAKKVEPKAESTPKKAAPAAPVPAKKTEATPKTAPATGPAKSAPSKTASPTAAAPVTKAPATTTPAKKTEVPPPAKAVTPPPPKSNAAPATKTDAPAKKDTTKKKPPAHEI
jgi:hypothetical protein